MRNFRFNPHLALRVRLSLARERIEVRVVVDVCLVRRIKQNESFVPMRIIDPVLQLLASCHRPSWIVRKAKVNQIDMLLWWVRHEIIFRSAGEIENPFVAAVLPRRTAMPCHYIRIDIDRINWVWNCDFVLVAENIENVSAIAVRSVRGKALLIGERNLA